MPRFSIRITAELLSQIHELEGNQRSDAQGMREILIEREIWKRLESDPFPAEYILPGGRSVKNKKAIEADIVDKYLPSAFQLAGQIEKLEQDLRNLRSKQSNELLKAMSGVTFFICHASSDKDHVARPLAEILVDLGASVWYDEYSMRIGDSIRQAIDRGLASARFGIVIVSPASLEKWWPNYELDGLFAKESIGGKPVILPVWHDVTLAEVARISPSLAGRRAACTSNGLTAVAGDLLASAA